MTQPDTGDQCYTASHTYAPDASGDHMVRVVSPVGAYAEFIGTPGASLEIRPPEISGSGQRQTFVFPGKKLPLKAFVTYDDPNMEPKDITNRADWSSSKRTVATVGNVSGTQSTKGVVLGRENGTTRITARFGGLQGTQQITVRKPGLSELFLDSPTGPPEVNVGGKLPLRATAEYQAGNERTVTDQTEWSSSDTQVAKVSNSGEVTGVSAGTAVITGEYSDEGETVSTELEVTVKATLSEGETEVEHGHDESGKGGDKGAGKDSGKESGKGSGEKDSGKESGNADKGSDKGSSDKESGNADQSGNADSNEQDNAGQGNAGGSDDNAGQAPNGEQGQTPEQNPGAGYPNDGMQPQYQQ